jgi:hypothetical protein
MSHFTPDQLAYRADVLISRVSYARSRRNFVWYGAIALSGAAPMRTLGLIEAPIAKLVSLKVFREPPSLREGLGISLR